jgi:hypothetical protein
MIPYDDLVAALQAWRARQGLPVSTQAPVAATSNGLTAAPARPGSPPPGPPPAPKKSTGSQTPLPLEPVDADLHLEVESALIEEAHYENEGDDFAMAFGTGNGNGHHHQSSDETLVGDDVPEATDPARSHNTRDDW